MFLFAGLGNPGTQYRKNRHNIGFIVADAIHYRHRFPAWRKRFHGQSAEGEIAGERVVLLKPETYMNDSGISVAAAQRFFKIELRDVFAFHDELDLPPAKLRVKLGGGNAGHNGLRSITALCGNDYTRVRFGIGHPGDKHLVHRYVLSDFAKDEQPWVETMCESVADASPDLVLRKPADFQNRVHLALAAKGFPPSEPTA